MQVLLLEHLAEAFGTPVGDEELQPRAVALSAVAVVAEHARDPRPDVGDARGLDEDAEPLRDVRVRRQTAADPQIEAGGAVGRSDTDERDVVDLVLCALLAAACSSVVGSDDDNFTFTWTPVSFDSTMVDQAAVATQLRNLQIDGLFLLPHPCFELRGDYRRTGAEIRFTASAYEADATCTAQLSAAMRVLVGCQGVTDPCQTVEAARRPGGDAQASPVSGPARCTGSGWC